MGHAAREEGRGEGEGGSERDGEGGGRERGREEERRSRSTLHNKKHRILGAAHNGTAAREGGNERGKERGREDRWRERKWKENITACPAQLVFAADLMTGRVQKKKDSSTLNCTERWKEEVNDNGRELTKERHFSEGQRQEGQLKHRRTQACMAQIVHLHGKKEKRRNGERNEEKKEEAWDEQVSLLVDSFDFHAMAVSGTSYTNSSWCRTSRFFQE